MFLLCSFFVTSTVTQAEYIPVIGVWPGLDFSFIKDQVLLRAQCNATCEYEEWSPTGSYDAVLLDGQSASMDAISSINGITIVLVFTKPVTKTPSATLLGILPNVTTILGYHSKSAYRLTEDEFDRIDNDLSQTINNIWRKKQKNEIYQKREVNGKQYNRDIAVLRDCQSSETEFNHMFNRLNSSYNIFDWGYKLHQIDKCGSPEKDRLRELKEEIAKFDTFIIDQQKFCDEYFPEISYTKRLSIPIIKGRDWSKSFPSKSIISEDDLKVGTWRRKRDNYFAWSDVYTRTPFHGRGICEICEILANNKTLVDDKDIEPYFNCTYMYIKPSVPEGKTGPKPKVTEMPEWLAIVIAGLLGMVVLVMCALALYYPVSNTIRRHFGSQITEE
ncbi:hypothetical protein PENTCL1PPCAC_28903 [Pristionchus entomophagus]|uniref:Uncharacterized protein n=1 Tax=Pristionchus entomophagus TaxID=358040 RepID=A0AAV5ULB7_9BILA|nr:hypothetical protein PENTCL1PPCAC_28903 [Pristionchus entomophagus]